MVDRKHATSILDVRSCRGTNCDSDHFLIRVKLRQRLSRLNEDNKYKRPRWDIEKLSKSEETKRHFQAALSEKLQQGKHDEKMRLPRNPMDKNKNSNHGRSN